MTPLEQAARAAQHAPSVFNTQPWTWRIAGNTMELHADRERRVGSIDQDGRLLLLSCGAALHHARVWLNAAGWSATVDYPMESSLLARIRIGGPTPPDPENERMAASIARRRTDRRAFGTRPVTPGELTKLRRFVEYEGAYLHVVEHDQVPMLAISTELAAGAELNDPAYREDLERWTTRASYHGDGLAPSSAVKPDVRRVPVRDFFPSTTAGLAPGPSHDQGAAYVVLFGNGDAPLDLLRGGEALSALLLLATADGLSTAPLSDAIEVEWPRHLLRSMLSDVGEPYIVVRLGYLPTSDPLPPVARRHPDDVITVTE